MWIVFAAVAFSASLAARSLACARVKGVSTGACDAVSTDGGRVAGAGARTASIRSTVVAAVVVVEGADVECRDVEDRMSPLSTLASPFWNEERKQM